MGQLLAVAWSIGVSVVILRTRALPQWIGWIGLAASVLYIANQGDILSTAVPSFPVWDAAGLLGSTAWGLWTILLGVGLYLSSRTRKAVEAQPQQVR